MNSVINQMSLLYEHELYSDIVKLSELAISLWDQKHDILMQFTKLQVYVYYGEALYTLQQYVKAENAYSIALQIKQHLNKTKTTSHVPEDERGLINDIRIKYKMHHCYLKLAKNKQALEMLQSISARTRTPQINMALGNLYRDSGMERPAIACYKEVLKECPLAVDAAQNLLKLGVKGVEVNSIMLVATVEVGWICTWIRGLAEMYSRDHNSAIATFQSLDVHGLLPRNTLVLTNLAYCYNYLCDDKNALATLQRVSHGDPLFIVGRDLFARLLSGEKENHQELERLMADYDTSLWTCEDWVVAGFHSFINSKYDKALYFGQQACLLNKRNIEALLLKGDTLMKINKYQEAACHYREALQNCPYRFESNSGLVQSYISMNRVREATAMANIACKEMNNLPQVLTLYASLLLKDPINSSRARNVLERVIASDPSSTTAICLLAEQLEQDQSYEEAVALIKRHLDIKPSSRMHQILGDCLLRLQKDEEAYMSYMTAIRMDPQNQRALEGIDNIGRSHADSSNYMSVGAETSTFESQPPTGSDHEPDLDNYMDQLRTRVHLSFE